MKWAAFVGLLLCIYASASSGATGQEIWSDQCAQCHGADGKAQTPMGKRRQIKNFADAKMQAQMTNEAMFTVIKDGRKSASGGTLMPPAEKVTDDDIKALIQIVRDFRQ